MGVDSIIKRRLNSLIDIKQMLKKYNIDDPIQYSAINELNTIFKKYIYGDKDIFCKIQFEEFNRVIDVKLYALNPQNNVVVMKRQ